MRLQWSGHSIDVREAGAGPCVVLLHGYPLDGAMWSGVARGLATRFRVLKPDLPGHGENPVAAPEHLDGHAEFVEAHRPGAAGARSGSPASRWAATSRSRSCAAAPPACARSPSSTRAPRPTTKRAGRSATRRSRVARSGGVAKIADAMVPKLLSEASLGNRDLTERLRRIILRQKPETVAADLAAMRDRRDSSGLLARFRIPTLVLVGEQDALTPPALSERMAVGDPGRTPRADSRRRAPDADGEARRRRGGARRVLRRVAGGLSRPSSSERNPHPEPDDRGRCSEGRLSVCRD